MNRSEYLNTRSGQISEHRKRFLKRQMFTFSNHEPKSKQSISDAEKVKFQKNLLTQMKVFSRSAYRSPIIVEVDFFANQDNPPSVYTMAKNYMDLLQKPVPGSGIRRKSLLFNDDRLASILIVNYSLVPNKKPSIRIKTDTMANFIQDLSLVKRIQRNDFEDDSFCYGISHEYNSTKKHDLEIDNPLKDLKRWDNQREDIVKKHNKQYFNAVRNFYLMQVQEYFLNTFELKIESLFSILNAFLPGSSFLEDIHAVNRNMIANPPFMIDLTHPPIEGVGKKVFKENVNKALQEFKMKYPFLFPLLHTVGILVLCVPPRTHGKYYGDLDNLARYVLPSVHEIFKPPSDMAFALNFLHDRDNQLTEYFRDRMKALKRMPKYSVTQYQIIRLPRLESDPEHGMVRIALYKSDTASGIWEQIDDIINSWKDL